MKHTQRSNYGIDIANTDMLTRRQVMRVRAIGEEFIKELQNNFGSLYLHLDVRADNRQTRGIPAYRWRALLVTDNGRFYAEDKDFGALESLRRTLNAVYSQIHTRLGKQEVKRMQL